MTERPYIPRAGAAVASQPRYPVSTGAQFKVWWREVDRVLVALILLLTIWVSLWGLSLRKQVRERRLVEGALSTQLKFIADQGFTAWFDNSLMGRPAAFAVAADYAAVPLAPRTVPAPGAKPFTRLDPAAAGLTANGLTWHTCRPPIVELEFEMDCRGVSVERILKA